MMRMNGTFDERNNKHMYMVKTEYTSISIHVY